MEDNLSNPSFNHPATDTTLRVRTVTSPLRSLGNQADNPVVLLLLILILMLIIIVKRISRAPVYHTRWEHRALYNNTND